MRKLGRTLTRPDPPLPLKDAITNDPEIERNGSQFAGARREPSRRERRARRAQRDATERAHTRSNSQLHALPTCARPLCALHSRFRCEALENAARRG